MAIFRVLEIVGYDCMMYTSKKIEVLNDPRPQPVT